MRSLGNRPLTVFYLCRFAQDFDCASVDWHAGIAGPSEEPALCKSIRLCYLSHVGAIKIERFYTHEGLLYRIIIMWFYIPACLHTYMYIAQTYIIHYTIDTYANILTYAQGLHAFTNSVMHIRRSTQHTHAHTNTYICAVCIGLPYTCKTIHISVGLHSL